jgi:hypothetical protein
MSPNTPSYDAGENRFVRHDTLESDNAGADTLTAHAGGGQAAALQLVQGINRVTVVATAGDSVKLPAAAAGVTVTVINADSTDSMNVFPFLGDAINALGANAAFALAAGKSVTFSAAGAGFFYGNLTA